MLTDTHTAASEGRTVRSVPFGEALRFWLKLGFISFGGPAGQIAIMHRELVERRRWISEDRFLHALNYCMLLPGPEAQQLATYVGWLLHRVRGGLVAGVLFVLPSVFVLLGLSYAYAAHGETRAVAGVLYGFRPVVVAIVCEAVLRIGRRAIRRRAHLALALAAFAAIYLFGVPFPLIVALAAWVGLGLAEPGGVLATGAAGLLLSTALAVVVVGGLEAVAFGLLPLRFLAGDAVYRWRRLLWALLFGLSAFLFIHLLVGPHTGYLSQLSPAAIAAALGAFAAFGAFSVLFWAYFRFRPARVTASS